MLRKPFKNNPCFMLCILSALLVLTISVTISSELITPFAKFVFATTDNNENGGEGTEGAGDGGDEGDQQENDQQGIDSQEEELPITDDQPQEGDQPLSCSEGQVVNPETGQCEEVQQEKQLVPDEICDNSIDDDLDGALDQADTDCMGVQGSQDTGIVEQSHLPSDTGIIMAPEDEAPPSEGTDAPPPLAPPAGPPATEDAGILSQLPDNLGDLVEPPATEDPGLVIQPPVSTDAIVVQDDSDGDGTPDTEDNCVNSSNPSQQDSDGDGRGDACDEDQRDEDGDGINNAKDNCIQHSNPDQKDSDDDGLGDACAGDGRSGYGLPGEGDYDGDGTPNFRDNCVIIHNPDQKDSDSDGIGEACDIVSAELEERPREDIDVLVGPQPSEKGLCNDGKDNDQDGLTDARDTDDCPIVQQKPPIGFDPFIQ
jgi:hypothetical protein